MQPRELLIQVPHLRRMLPLLPILLPIPRLLMFSLLHHLGRARPKHQQVRRRSHKHACQGSEHAPPVPLVQDAIDTAWDVVADGVAEWLPRGGVREREGDGQRRLDGKVHGRQGGLEGGEGGAGQRAVGYDASDEGLVDGGAEEGAVADMISRSVWRREDVGRRR